MKFPDITKQELAQLKKFGESEDYRPPKKILDSLMNKELIYVDRLPDQLDMTDMGLAYWLQTQRSGGKVARKMSAKTAWKLYGIRKPTFEAARRRVELL